MMIAWIVIHDELASSADRRWVLNDFVATSGRISQCRFFVLEHHRGIIDREMLIADDRISSLVGPASCFSATTTTDPLISFSCVITKV